jgi:hypothetical protein
VRGLEAELTPVLDSMSGMLPALRAFSTNFLTVSPRVYVQSLGSAAELVLDREFTIGFLPIFFSEEAVSAPHRQSRQRRRAGFPRLREVIPLTHCQGFTNR